MRRPATIMRATGAVLVALGVAFVVAVPAQAGPTPSPTPSPTPTPDPTPIGEPICTVTDPAATELSGLVATPTGYVAINDSNDDADRIRIFYLDQRCRVTKTIGYPTPARDPEDVAQAPDGTLWVSDTGDNITSSTRRATIALWQVPQGGGSPVIYRLTYPDGPHDAEALFFTPAGTPVIVTKEISGVSGMYEPVRAMQPRTAAGVPLKRVGQFTPTPTGVPNPLDEIGEILVTGAATSPDRRRVALRTYSAAYEWDVPDGDPVKAITTRTPRVTPLPAEPQGESLAYTVDGSAFLTVSDQQGPTILRRYRPSTTAASVPGAAVTIGPPTLEPSPPAVARALESIPGWAMISVAGIGLILAAAGLIGVLRGRRSGRHVG